MFLPTDRKSSLSEKLIVIPLDHMQPHLSFKSQFGSEANDELNQKDKIRDNKFRGLSVRDSNRLVELSFVFAPRVQGSELIGLSCKFSA